MVRDQKELSELYLKIQDQILNKHSNILFDAIKALSEHKQDDAKEAMNKLNEYIKDALKENGVNKEEHEVISKLMLTSQWQNSLKELIMKGLKHD